MCVCLCVCVYLDQLLLVRFVVVVVVAYMSKWERRKRESAKLKKQRTSNLTTVYNMQITKNTLIRINILLLLRYLARIEVIL